MNLSVDNFRTKFFQDGNPYWRVFKGRNAGKESFVIAANTSMEDMEQSWSMLEQTFSLYPYGSVTVVTKSSPHAKDGIQSWIEWGQQPAAAGPGLRYRVLITARDPWESMASSRCGTLVRACFNPR
jgi:hypothetical protein